MMGAVLRRCLILALSSIFLALAGCGSGKSKHSTGSTPAQGSSTATAPQANGTATSANQLLAESASALRSAGSYAMRGTLTQNGRPTGLDLVTSGPKSLAVTLTVAGASVRVIVLPSASFIRGSRAFWTSHLGARGASLAGRWIEVPSANAQTLAASMGHFQPATLSRCLTEDHGTLTIAGRTSVDGRSAIVIRDAGNLPGSAPGTLAVAATDPHYPLRITATGAQRPGGRIDVCNTGRASSARGSLTFSQFGTVPAITAPGGATRLGQGTSA